MCTLRTNRVKRMLERKKIGGPLYFKVFSISRKTPKEFGYPVWRTGESLL